MSIKNPLNRDGWSLTIAAFAVLFTTAGVFLSIYPQGEQTTTDAWCLNPPQASMANCQEVYTVYHRTSSGFAYFGEIGFSMVLAGIIGLLSAAAALVIIYADAGLRAYRRRKSAA